MTVAIIIAASFLVLMLIFMAQSVFIVSQSEVVIIERLGRYHKTLHSGLNFVIPMVDKVREFIWKFAIQREGRVHYFERMVARMDLRETVYDFPRQHVITKDNVTIEINALLYFQITDPKSAIYEIANLPEAIEKLTQTTLRNVIGELDLDETLVSRDTINHKLRLILDEATDKWGVKVNRVELQDIVPPVEIRESMEKQMKAERQKRAAILTAEGEKAAQILTAEGSKESAIRKAEGERTAQILKAEGVAQYKLKVAEAEAEAIAKIQGSSKGKAEGYLITTKYIEAIKELAKGDNKNKTIFMPFESSNFLSSIGSLKEMFNIKDEK